MDYEVAMRIGNCLTYLREETHPLRQRRVSARAVLRDRLALDEFHCHVGPAVWCDSSIVKARDTRVLQARQDLALHVETLELGNCLAPQEFDRDPLREVAFGAHGLVNDTHTAAAYMARNLPGSDAHVWRDRLDRSLHANACGRREESSKLLRGTQQALDLLQDGRVIAAVAIQIISASLHRRVQQDIQQLIDANSLGGGECGHGSFREYSTENGMNELPRVAIRAARHFHLDEHRTIRGKGSLERRA